MADQTYALAKSGVYGLSSGVYTNALGSSIPDSAIHRYKFAEGSGTSVADSIGTNDVSFTDLSWTTGSYIEDAAGVTDGIDDRGEASNIGDLDGATEAWVAATVNANDVSAQQVITMVGGGSSTTGGGNDNFRLGINNGEAEFFVDAGTSNQWVSGGALSTGTNYRIVGRYDGSSQEIWVNASQVASTPQSGGIASSDAYMTIADRLGTDHYLDGTLDDILWGVGTLTDSDIQDDYDRQPWS